MTQTQYKWLTVFLSLGIVLMLCLPSANAGKGKGKSKVLLGENTDGTYFIDVPVYFPPGSKRFFPRHRKRLKKVAKFLKAYPDITEVQVFGYTDRKESRRKSGAISLKRAKVVQKFLIRQGVAAKRLIVNKAEQDFSGPKLSRLKQRKLRRVEFVIPLPTQPQPEPEPYAANEPVLEETPEPTPVVKVTPAIPPEPKVEPTPKLAAEPIPEPVAEPIAKPASQPAIEPIPEIIAEPVPEAPLIIEPVSLTANAPDYFSFNYLMEHPEHLAATGTGLLLTVGVTFGVLANASLSDMAPLYKGSQEWQSAKNSADSQALIANVFYGLAAAGALGTGWLYYQAFTEPASSVPDTTISVAPAQGGARFLLQLQF